MAEHCAQGVLSALTQPIGNLLGVWASARKTLPAALQSGGPGLFDRLLKQRLALGIRDRALEDEQFACQQARLVTALCQRLK